MQENNWNVLEKMELAQGLEIDLEEGWRKLISRQFGGEPPRAFREIMQNFVDSYPPGTPWEDRWGKIEAGTHSISMIDYGEGMKLSRLKLIATLGGTDKGDDPEKIGRFGIGFFSIFNPGLGTKKVCVITMCEGHHVELDFIVEQPWQRPKIKTRLLNDKLPFSTKITIEFDNEDSSQQCLKHAVQSLEYYRCRVLVNNKPFHSVWERAKLTDAYFFQDGYCEGFLRSGSWAKYITVLCKYEYIMRISLPYLISGHRLKNDLRDFELREIPFLPTIEATVNCNNLNVTISRDSFYLNSAFDDMITVLRDALLIHIGNTIDSDPDRHVILANHYILRKRLKAYLDGLSGTIKSTDMDRVNSAIQKLAKAKVYRLNGRKDFFSLADIYHMLGKDTPLFFAPKQSNLRWLGGEFRHDFIVLPDTCTAGSGAPFFYDILFKELFDDVVNLDRIRQDTEKVRELVKRGIVRESALSPKCEIVGSSRVSVEEQGLLDEIDVVLAHEEVRDAIARHLFVPAQNIKTVFFKIEESGATIATGLFDHTGNALNMQVPDNVRPEELSESNRNPVQEKEIMLGLRLDHPFIKHLLKSRDSHRAYYTLVYLAHELTLCQKLLVPASPFFHEVKEQLASDMRRAMLGKLLSV